MGGKDPQDRGGDLAGSTGGGGGAAQAKFGSAVAGPDADGQQGLVLETPQWSLWRSAPASAREVALTSRPEPLPAGICPEAPCPESQAPHWGASGRISAGNNGLSFHSHH